MSERIYDLKIGESFAIYGGAQLNGSVFAVESILQDTAVCVSQDGASRLILPLNAAMPFAVQVFTPSKKSASAINKPAAEAAVPESRAVTENDTEETASKRLCSTIDFFMPRENWGKIHVDGFPKGIFFHISQVEDEEFRKYLAALPTGTRLPKLKVSYQRCCNVGRNNALCAGAIHLEEPLESCEAAQPEPDTEHDGYLVEMACNGMLTILDCETSRENRTRLTTLIDPYLKAYLDQHAGFGNLDGEGIKVHYLLRGKSMTRVEWSNRDEVLQAKEVSLDEAVDAAALEKWNGTEAGEEEKAEEERPVPPYQPLPLWRNRRVHAE